MFRIGFVQKSNKVGGVNLRWCSSPLEFPVKYESLVFLAWVDPESRARPPYLAKELPVSSAKLAELLPRRPFRVVKDILLVEKHDRVFSHELAGEGDEGRALALFVVVSNDVNLIHMAELFEKKKQLIFSAVLGQAPNKHLDGLSARLHVRRESESFNFSVRVFDLNWADVFVQDGLAVNTENRVLGLINVGEPDEGASLGAVGVSNDIALHNEAVFVEYFQKLFVSHVLGNSINEQLYRSISSLGPSSVVLLVNKADVLELVASQRAQRVSLSDKPLSSGRRHGNGTRNGVSGRVCIRPTLHASNHGPVPHMGVFARTGGVSGQRTTHVAVRPGVADGTKVSGMLAGANSGILDIVGEIRTNVVVEKQIAGVPNTRYEGIQLVLAHGRNLVEVDEVALLVVAVKRGRKTVASIKESLGNSCELRGSRSASCAISRAIRVLARPERLSFNNVLVTSAVHH
ncbi:hypothetical protein HWI79_1614 [Cryptosporidium felis]|nr:hypothetical protein HWI79_1614 [Cryptosporidium felis]